MENEDKKIDGDFYDDEHSQRPKFLEPSAREKAEEGYFINEDDEPVDLDRVHSFEISKINPEQKSVEQQSSACEKELKSLTKPSYSNEIAQEIQPICPDQPKKESAKPENSVKSQSTDEIKKTIETKTDKNTKKTISHKNKERATTAEKPAEAVDKEKIEAIKKAKQEYKQEAYEHSGAAALPPSEKNGKKPKKKKSKGKTINTILFVGVIVAVSVMLSALILVGLNDVYAIMKPSASIIINIPQGATSNDIVEILDTNKVINQPWIFKIVMKLRKDGNQFQYGTYTLNSDMDYDTIIEKLKEKNAENNENIEELTFTEGSNLEDIAADLEKKGICKADDFKNAVNRKAYGLNMESHLLDVDLSLKYNRMEGYLFPDTYQFFKGESAESVAHKMLSNLDKRLSDEMYTKMESLNLTLDQTITLASIVQAEAGSVEDMALVSSVFHNRINSQGAYPKLQSDPTKRYAINLQEKLTSEGLPYEDIVKAYNTYESAGIPAGAICNPGMDAINAVLNPASTGYYYFCANLDSKECFYAETLEQHNQNLVQAGLK